ncbi:MAG: signal peptidase I [Termitinemataceae bacterium]|nr:MAG: signal peptidase I [Termitinemataceae bacterium]
MSAQSIDGDINLLFFSKWLKYSYVDQKTQNIRTRAKVLTVILFFVVYILITNYLFMFKILENSSMEPGLKKGDRFILYSFKLQKSLPDSFAISHLPLKHGNVVLINNYQNKKENVFESFVDKLFRFFTIGGAGFPGKESRLFLKRVVALEGDTVSMTNYIMRVQPAGESYTYTEFELSGKTNYDVNVPSVSALWDTSIPFSGNIEKFTLGKDQCFVLSDDRSNTNDSTTWGPIDTDLIQGKVILRYWPLNRLGFPD